MDGAGFLEGAGAEGDSNPGTFGAGITRIAAPEISACQMTGTLSATPCLGGGYEIRAGDGAALQLSLEEPVCDSILLLQFKVENHGSAGVVIDADGIRNKLSGKSAAYPNGNQVFHYQFSEADGVKTLLFSFSRGSYRLSDIRWYLCPKSLLDRKEYTAMQCRGTAGQEILSGTVQTEGEGWLVTSIPMQDGLSIAVDGKKVPALCVNTAFAGAALGPGEHEIVISFSVPGLSAGKVISALCFLCFVVHGYLCGRGASQACALCSKGFLFL